MQLKTWSINLTILLICAFFTISCNSNLSVKNSQIEEIKKNNNESSLKLEANGEDFIRQGFTSKDGWQIKFNQVKVTLANVTAYQTEPPFSTEVETKLSPLVTTKLVETPITIDLAEGDENAKPILVIEKPAKEGIYNALSWQIQPEEGKKETILIDGIATKDNQTINFVISVDKSLDYMCGEFVGEERKGIVTQEKKGIVEITFHFDHIFGDAKTPMTEALNKEALGFQPLADIAQNNQLKTYLTNLQKKLSPSDYEKLAKSILSLGHVGEGHCNLLNS